MQADRERSGELARLSEKIEEGKWAEKKLMKKKEKMFRDKIGEEGEEWLQRTKTTEREVIGTGHHQEDN